MMRNQTAVALASSLIATKAAGIEDVSVAVVDTFIDAVDDGVWFDLS